MILKMTRLLSVTLSLLLFVPAIAQDAPLAHMPEKHFAFFESHCVDCHDDVNTEGSLDLYEVDFDLSTIQSAETWQKILNSINSGEMPPEDKKQPSDEDKTAFLEDLSQQLVEARALLSDTGGEITMRRLNRREYENTIYDLLGIRISTEDLPDDQNPGGFDTAGGSLFFSSDQFEQYHKIAKRILEGAFVWGKAPETKKDRVQIEEKINKRVTNQLAKIQEDWDRAQAWRNSDGGDPTDFGFIDSARVKFEEGVYKREAPGYQAYLDHPNTGNGAVLYTSFQGALVATPDLPGSLPSGHYKIRVKAAVLNDNVPYERRFIEYGNRVGGEIGGEINVQGCFHVTGTMEKPQVIEIPIFLGKNDSRFFGIRERQVNNRDFARQLFQQARAKDMPFPAPALWVDWIEWEGPFLDEWPPKSQKAILVKSIDQKMDSAAAREVFENFATKAFRGRKPSPAYLDKLVALFEAELAATGKPVLSLVEPLAVILSSPSFLYLSEPFEKPWIKDDKKPYPERVPLTKREFAIRLAYFLWSSPPDEELMEVAMSGDLKKPEVLRQQVDRMLDDPRSWEFVTGFTHQWLHMERLDFFNYNHRLYPHFDESVKESARNEVFHTIQYILDERRPVGDLLNPDYLVVNDVLINYYRLKALRGGIEGTEFRKLAIPEDNPRGGLLGMAAILAMGSDGERTSPVERGAWIMRKLLHNPPPPAPPNVPQLSRNADKPISARQLLTLHNEEAQCAQCHKKIDPLGFGLEHFDAAGLWREKERAEVVQGRRVVKTQNHKIDDSGTLPDGTPFANFNQLRKEVGKREKDFAQGFTEHLIEYGLGRPFGFTDLNLADSIMAQAKKEDYAMREFVHALAQSKAFRLK